MTKEPINWMLSEAIGSLARAERLRQQLDRLLQSRGPFVLRDVMLTDVEPLAAGQ